MKKLLTLLLVLVIVMAVSIPAFAHPMVPEQSIGNVSVNAAGGLHKAWANIQDANGVASHVFSMRHSPH